MNNDYTLQIYNAKDLKETVLQMLTNYYIKCDNFTS